MVIAKKGPFVYRMGIPADERWRWAAKSALDQETRARLRDSLTEIEEYLAEPSA